MSAMLDQLGTIKRLPSSLLIKLKDNPILKKITPEIILN